MTSRVLIGGKKARTMMSTLRSGERSLGSLRNHPAFFFGDHGHDSDRQAISARHVGRHEINSCFLQSEQKMRVSTQSV
jgi:hypothetical protein